MGGKCPDGEASNEGLHLCRAEQLDHKQSPLQLPRDYTDYTSGYGYL